MIKTIFHNCLIAFEYYENNKLIESHKLNEYKTIRGLLNRKSYLLKKAKNQNKLNSIKILANYKKLTKTEYQALFTYKNKKLKSNEILKLFDCEYKPKKYYKNKNDIEKRCFKCCNYYFCESLKILNKESLKND